MGIVSGMLRPERRDTTTSLRDLTRLPGWAPTSAAGVVVSRERALRLAAFASCVRVISEDVAALPWHLHRRLSPRGKERAVEHPVYSLAHDLPNPELTSFELRENIVGHLITWGWAYCEIEFDGAGRRRALWPLRPDRMEQTLTEDNERLFVYTLPSGQRLALPRWRVWVVRGWSLEAWAANSLIDVGREAIGLGVAAEDYGARFYANDSRPGGILKSSKGLRPDAAANLKRSWEEAFGGLSNRHRVAVLEDGIEWQQIGIAPENAQFLETRKYQRSEIAGLMRVPPHKIGDLERATFSNIEQQEISYANDVLLPMCARLDQSANRDLLSASERKTYFLEHFLAARLRGELKARYEAYAIGLGNRFLCPDDVREAENMNPLPDGQGRIFMGPLNMAPVGSEPEADPATTPGKPTPGSAQDAKEGGGDDETTD